MKTPSATAATPVPSHQDISRRAKAIWEGRGCPSGCDQEIWLEAERQLLGIDTEVEGRAGASVVAVDFDQATARGKPVSRAGRPPAAKAGAAASRSRR